MFDCGKIGELMFDLLFDDLSWFCWFGGFDVMFGLYRPEFLPILGLVRFFLGFWDLNKFAFLVLFCLVGFLLAVWGLMLLF